MDEVRPSSGWQWLGANVALAAGYAVIGKLALLLALPPGYAAPFFLSAGIALAAVATCGAALLPGVALGSLLLNGHAAWTGPVPFAAALPAVLLVVAGSTLQAWVGAALFRRLVDPALASAHDVLTFLLLAPLTCLVSASIAVPGLTLRGLVDIDLARVNWLLWWAGDSIGVLLAAPLTWLAIGRPRALWRRRRWLLGLPLCLSSVAFVVIFDKVSVWEERQQLAEFHLQAHQLTDVLQSQFSEHERLLFAIGNLYAQSRISTPAAFSRLARSYLDNRPELRLISWAPRVTLAERPAFEQWAAGVVEPGFQVRQFVPGQAPRPAGARDAYFATTFIEPLAGNRRVLGLDMLSEPVRAAMVKAAMARRTPTASEPIDLVQASVAKKGLLLAQMAYPPEDADAAPPLGMLVAVLQVEPYLKHALERTAGQQLLVRLDDVTDPARRAPMFDSLVRASRAADDVALLTLGGRTYRITVAPSEAYLRAHQGWQSSLTLAGGLFLTACLGAFLLLLSGQREHIQAEVVARTRELREREARLKAILDEAAEAILTVTRAGEVVAANSAAGTLFGYRLQQLHGQRFDALAGVQGGDPAAAPLPDALAAGQVGAELVGRRADKSVFPLAAAVSLVELPDESFFVCILRDLTEQRRAEEKALALEALKQAQNDLIAAEKMAALGSLVAGVAHELNTPIGNSLLTVTALGDRVDAFQATLASGAVKRTVLEEHMHAAREACALLARSLHRMAELISSFKQIAVDQAVGQRRSFQLRQLLHDALLTHAASLRRLRCDTVLDVDADLFLDSYPGSLAQVVGNLVNNALLHAFEGRASGRIRIGAQALDDDWVEVVFEDNGVGMAPEIVNRVFDPFFTTKLGQGSSGLGMHIVYNIVTGTLKGRISIAATLGQGTRVTLRLPRRVA